jgi:hypothetical protein
VASEVLTYDKSELSSITRAFKAMDDEAAKEAKEKSGSLVEYLKGKIITKAGSMKNNKAPLRIAQGASVAKSSKIGEINLGFARQKFSGGGTTQINQGKEPGGKLGILGGYEFGSNTYRQFPIWSGSNPAGGAGSKGYFIYPTLREEQPYLIKQWEISVVNVVKKWS